MDLEASHLLVWCAIGVAGVVLLLIRHEGTRRRLGPHVIALAERAATHFQPDDEVDPLAEALRMQLRREKLVADIQRLRRLVATDMGRSAVRQIGNRIAYASLVAEYEALREAPTSYAFSSVQLPTAAMIPAARWHNETLHDEIMINVSLSRSRGDLGQRPPAVEVLELGPRRRPAH